MSKIFFSDSNTSTASEGRIRSKSSTKKTTFLKQIDFFDALMQGKIVNPYFFLQDGLHLNKHGYKVLKNHLKPFL